MLSFQRYHQITSMKGDAITTNNTTNIHVSSTDNIPSSVAPPSPIYVYHMQGQIFGYDQVTIDCPYCKAVITTKIKRKRGSYPWIMCGILSVFGCFLCSCIPFCANNLKSVILVFFFKNGLLSIACLYVKNFQVCYSKRLKSSFWPIGVFID